MRTSEAQITEKIRTSSLDKKKRCSYEKKGVLQRITQIARLGNNAISRTTATITNWKWKQQQQQQQGKRERTKW